MAVLGDPGSGKTTLLRHLARTYSLRRQGDLGYPPESLVPLYVRAADWAEQLAIDESAGLADAATLHLGLADPVATAAWLKEAAEKERVLVLVDGLDEVADPAGQTLLLEKIRSFMDAHPDVRLITTSRIVGFEPPVIEPRVDVLVVEPLRVDAMRRFAIEWCAFRHHHEAQHRCPACEKRVEEFRHAIIDHPRIRELAGNPMMLTILALLHEAGAALPQRRWDLYERIAEALLFTWQSRKGAARPGALDRALTLEDRELLWALESLAVEMQKGDRTLVARWWLLEHLRSFLQGELGWAPDAAQSEVEALVWSLQKRAGLLVERGPERFGFPHLAFQEYFAARAVLASEDPLGTLQPYFYHPRWNEVVRLVASRLDRRRAPQLIRMLLDDPDPTGRFIRRGLLLALGCLADGAAVHEEKLLSQLVDAVGELSGTKWVGIALDAVRTLREMRDGRFRDFVAQCAGRLMESPTPGFEPVDLLTVTMAALELKPEEHVEDGKEAEAGRGEQEDPHEPIMEFVFEKGRETTSTTVVVAPDASLSDWVDGVLRQLSADPSPEVRRRCAQELGRYARRAKVRDGLSHSLGTEQNGNVRAAIAEALEPVASSPEIRDKLEHCLVADEDPLVRGGCAIALRRVASREPGVRGRLLTLLRSGEAAPARCGAARGLSLCAEKWPEVRDALLEIARSRDGSDLVRRDCLWALENVLPALPDGLSLLCSLVTEDPDSRLSLVAAELLASYAATGRMEWGLLPIERIEHVLVSQKQPCPCALHALRGLVDARELRRLGAPREARIARTLASVRDKIRSAFVFGSSVRGEQRAESDVDLMVIGNVSLRELTPGLKQAEQELGRQINTVIYLEDEWRRRLRERDSFVSRVLAGKRSFVIGDEDELRAVGA
jgi:predicted nucleotidyltransferase/energy-coupling factor transporter ATP-binding protein EcfA2